MRAEHMEAWEQARTWMGALCDGAPDPATFATYAAVELELDGLVDETDRPAAQLAEETDRARVYERAREAVAGLEAADIDRFAVGLALADLESAWESEQAAVRR